MEDFNRQRPFRPVALGDRLPGARGLLLRPVIHPERRRLGLQYGRGAAPCRDRRRDDRLRILQINSLIFMDIADKEFSIIVQGP